MNQKDCKTKDSPDQLYKKKHWYVVYIAYQLVESTTFSQVMVETVFYGADIEQKKKQILCQLGDLKMSPPVDDKIRKIIQDIKVFMRKDQVELLHQVSRLGGRKRKSLWNIWTACSENSQDREKLQNCGEERAVCCKKRMLVWKGTEMRVGMQGEKKGMLLTLLKEIKTNETLNDKKYR